MEEYYNLKKEVEAATKLSRIDSSGDPVVVEAVLGLQLFRNGSKAKTKMITARRSEKVLDYLASVPVQEKLLDPKKRGIILLDVVGYSRHDTSAQAAILSLLNDTIKSSLRHQNIFSSDKTIEQIIPTGDGCYVVFHHSLNLRFFRAVCGIKAGLHCRQIRMVKQSDENAADELLQITIACHLGEVDFFTDAAGNRNCFGDGMNNCARILDLGKSHVKKEWPNRKIAGTVFFGAEVLAQAWFVMENLNKAYGKDEAQLTHLGIHKDKHGFDHDISWLTGISNHIALPFHSINEPEVQPIFFRA